MKFFDNAVLKVSFAFFFRQSMAICFFSSGIVNGRWYCCFTQEALRAKAQPRD